jgi:hypothetical protein
MGIERPTVLVLELVEARQVKVTVAVPHPAVFVVVPNFGMDVSLSAPIDSIAAVKTPACRCEAHKGFRTFGPTGSAILFWQPGSAHSAERPPGSLFT